MLLHSSKPAERFDAHFLCERRINKDSSSLPTAMEIVVCGAPSDDWVSLGLSLFSLIILTGCVSIDHEKNHTFLWVLVCLSYLRRVRLHKKKHLNIHKVMRLLLCQGESLIREFETIKRYTIFVTNWEKMHCATSDDAYTQLRRSKLATWATMSPLVATAKSSDLAMGVYEYQILVLYPHEDPSGWAAGEWIFTSGFHPDAKRTCFDAGRH